MKIKDIPSEILNEVTSLVGQDGVDLHGCRFEVMLWERYGRRWSSGDGRLSQRRIMTIPVPKSDGVGVGITDQIPERCLYTIPAAFAKRPQPADLHEARPSMTARIYKPAKNAMQSGKAKTREWQLDYEPEQPRSIEPLMGWTSSADMKQQLTLRFETREDAVAYCERKGIPYEVIEPKASAQRQAAYADNFAFRRGEPWTH